MAKGAYIGAPMTETMTSNNIGSWFNFSDPDGTSSWSGTTLTITGVYADEEVKLTALSDMTVSFDYSADSFCKIWFNNKYICDGGDRGSYTGTLPAGKSFYFYNSSAISTQTSTISNITCTKAAPVAHKVKGYIGIPTLKSLGNMAEGSIVKINENGSPVEFYVAKHNYESEKNGAGRTLVVRKDCYDTRAWDSTSNDYSMSDIGSWLNGTYKGMLDADIQSAMGGTWFRESTGNSTSTSMLKRSVFLLSVTELGNTASYASTEGSALPIASTLRVARLDGVKTSQWTRTPNNGNTTYACYLTTSGTTNYSQVSQEYGSRPCFTLPATVGITNGLITGAEAETKEVARRIKKAYIGVDGVARLCWEDNS